MTTEEFIKKAHKVHGEIYDYSETIYKNTKTKVTIICEEHGAFEQRPTRHLSGDGCPICGAKAMGDKQKLTTEEFIEKACKVHSDLYTYEHVDYKDRYTKVTITCPKHGVFDQVSSYHLQGNGCQKCSNSKGERIIEDYLEIYGISFESQKTFKECKSIRRLSFDFYLPDHNLLIEYQGIQHYKPIKYFGGESQFKKQKKHDQIKRTFAKNNGFKLIEISYKDFKSIPTIIEAHLSANSIYL